MANKPTDWSALESSSPLSWKGPAELRTVVSSLPGTMRGPLEKALAAPGGDREQERRDGGIAAGVLPLLSPDPPMRSWMTIVPKTDGTFGGPIVGAGGGSVLQESGRN